MKRMSRPVLIGALLLIFLTSACGRLSFASPTPVWTLPPGGVPVFPTTTLLALPTATGSALTPEIPITGVDVVSVQCQFCVEREAHVVLIFPDSVQFDVSKGSIPVSCVTAAVAGGKRILVCHGTQSSTFNLNICPDSSDCLQFPVALQPCPLLEAGATPVATGTPYSLVPVNTLKAPTQKSTNTAATAIPSRTPAPGGVPATSTTAADTPTGSAPTPVPPSSPTSYP